MDSFEALIRYNIPGAIVLIPFIFWLHRIFPELTGEALAFLYVGSSIFAGFIVHQAFLTFWLNTCWGSPWNRPWVLEAKRKLEPHYTEPRFRKIYGNVEKGNKYFPAFAWMYYSNQKEVWDVGTALTRWKWWQDSLGSTFLALVISSVIWIPLVGDRQYALVHLLVVASLIPVGHQFCHVACKYRNTGKYLAKLKIEELLCAVYPKCEKANNRKKVDGSGGSALGRKPGNLADDWA